MAYVELRARTIIGSDCYIDSRVSTSGQCVIGDRVTLRYGAIVARGCTIGDDTFLAPRVMTESLDHGQFPVGGPKVGRRCFIGTGSVIAAGVTICDDVIVGSCSYVNRDISVPGTYVGTPARMIREAP